MKRLVTVVLFIALSGAFIALSGTGALAGDFRQRGSQQDWTVSEDDIKAEVQFGREVAARILGRHKLHEDEQLTKYVNLIGKTVAENAGRPEIEFRFGVLQADYPNAYAAPGGYIFITKGAIDAAEDESELAAVLAHEVAHVKGKHIVKELNIKASEDSPVSGVVRLLGASGDPAKTAFLKATDKAVEILFERGYKIEDELDADKTGTGLLALSGYDPTALHRYLERILKSGQKTASKTHPLPPERLNALSKMTEEEDLSGLAPVKGKERFDAFKK